MKRALLIILAALSVSCALDEHRPNVPVKEAGEESAAVTILGTDYEVAQARCQSLYYKFVDDDVNILYIDLSDNGGIIVETSRKLLGRRVEMGRGDAFWFFSIGDGKGPFRSFRNTDADLDGYTGWFYLAIDEQAAQYLLEFEVEKDGEHFARGNTSGAFGVITPNIDPE